MTDTNYEDKYNELTAFLKGEYSTRLQNELGDHIAKSFLLSLLRPWTQPNVPVDAAESITDKVKQIMALDMEEAEKDKLIESLMGRKDDDTE